VELRTKKGRQWSSEGVRPVGASYSERGVPDIRLSKEALEGTLTPESRTRLLEVAVSEGGTGVWLSVGLTGYWDWSSEVQRGSWRLKRYTAVCVVNLPHLEASVRAVYVWYSVASPEAVRE
jgi:hypothetical protein